MSGYKVVRSKALSSEDTWLYLPTPGATRTGKYPVILAHGAGTPDQYAGVGWPASVNLAAVLARAGIPVIAPALGGDLYANDTAMARIDAALTYVAAQTGSSSAKAHLLGTSMGGGTIYRYAALNPTKVASCSGVVPMASPSSLHKSNVGGTITTGFASLIAAAWGTAYSTFTVTLTNGQTSVTATVGTFTAGQSGYYAVKNTGSNQALDTTIPIGTTFTFASTTTGTLSAPFTGTTGSYVIGLAQPLPAGADIISQAGAIASAGIPNRCFYSTIDPYILTTDVTALCTAAAGTAIAIDSTAGHSNGTFAEVGTYNGGSGFSDLLAWLLARGA